MVHHCGRSGEIRFPDVASMITHVKLKLKLILYGDISWSLNKGALQDAGPCTICIDCMIRGGLFDGYAARIDVRRIVRGALRTWELVLLYYGSGSAPAHCYEYHEQHWGYRCIPVRTVTLRTEYQYQYWPGTATISTDRIPVQCVCAVCSVL